MAGLLFKDSKSVRTGLRPFENVLNELVEYYGCVRQVCEAGNMSWSTIDMLRNEHRLTNPTMQKLMDLHSVMREQKLAKKAA